MIAAGELYRVVRAPDLLPAVTVGLGATVALLALGYARGARAPESFPFVVAAALFLSFVVLLFRRDRANVTRAVASTLIPVVCVALPGAYIVALRSARGGYRLAWVFLLMAFAAEAGAVTLTWVMRRRALTPRARRTWEHLGGALAGALIAAIIAATGASPPFTWALMKKTTIVTRIRRMRRRLSTLARRDRMGVSRSMMLLGRGSLGVVYVRCAGPRCERVETTLGAL